VFLMTSLGRTVYALTGSGKTLWQSKTSGPVYTLAILHGDRVAVGDDAGYVTLLDARGRRVWRRDLSALAANSAGGSRITALQGWQDGLLAGGWEECLTFLSADGDLRWQADLDGPVSSVAASSDWALAATLDATGGRLYAFDSTGKELWQSDAPAPIGAIEIVEGTEGMIALAGRQDGHLLALDRKGRLRWHQAFGAEGNPVWQIADLNGDASAEIVVGTGGTMPVLALLSVDGEMLWRVTVPSSVGAVAILDLDGDGEREILAGLSSGEILAFDRRGRRRGSIHAGLSVWGLEAAEDAVLVRADVVAWQLRPGDGPTGGPWLPAPAMLPVPPDRLPSGAERTGDEAVLVFLGDVALGRSVEGQLARYGAHYPWEGVGLLLHEADLAVANLEGVLTTRGEPLNKPYLIRAHPHWGPTLVEAGLDLVTLANNHALDFGPEGLNETLDTLAALDIAAVGAARSEDASLARRPVAFDINGVRVAVLGYAAARWNGSADVPPTDRIAWAEPKIVAADVRNARDQVDFVVVLLHAGTEYATEPSSDQVVVAHTAIDAGADLVVGHHPHVTQTVERYRQGLIVYSVGDALFDIPRPAAMRGHLLRVHITREGLRQAELWPFWIDVERGYRLRLLDDGQGGPRFRRIYP
jgi:poly-gamma-glutamate synthesis protein (capsule biosynthesis protein)